MAPGTEELLCFYLAKLVYTHDGNFCHGMYSIGLEQAQWRVMLLRKCYVAHTSRAQKMASELRPEAGILLLS